jgi:hypothetical protein
MSEGLALRLELYDGNISWGEYVKSRESLINKNIKKQEEFIRSKR